MNMLVREFLDMFVTPNTQFFRLYDNYTEQIIFEGYLTDIPENKKYLECAEVTSVDNIQNSPYSEPLTLNIDILEYVTD